VIFRGRCPSKIRPEACGSETCAVFLLDSPRPSPRVSPVSLGPEPRLDPSTTNSRSGSRSSPPASEPAAGMRDEQARPAYCRTGQQDIPPMLLWKLKCRSAPRGYPDFTRTRTRIRSLWLSSALTPALDSTPSTAGRHLKLPANSTRSRRRTSDPLRVAEHNIVNVGTAEVNVLLYQRVLSAFKLVPGLRKHNWESKWMGMGWAEVRHSRRKVRCLSR
jgi:hypothetical protein